MKTKMIIAESIKKIQQRVKEIKSTGKSIALVPTMGNLHRGHLALIDEANKHADKTIVSVFVNPLQFNNADDLENYPRTISQDLQKLRQKNVDTVFLPSNEIIYPEGVKKHTYIEVPLISDILCGKNRPGHFRGVATIVNKLFQLTQPDVAVFGRKDFQQLAVIRKMTTDLVLNIKIIGLPTIREESGLAMSSRNNRLTDEEKINAANIYQIMQDTKKQILAGDFDYNKLEQQALSQLASLHFIPDYFEIREREHLLKATIEDKKLIIFSAAYLGKPRLIDNITFDL